MGLKPFTIDFSDLAKNDNVRLWVPFVLPELKYKYDKINNFLDLCESGSRPKGGISNKDDGEAISLGGEQIGSDRNVNLLKIPYVSYDFYENANQGKVENNDILICKDGALTGKTCFVDFSIFPSKAVMVNEHVYILRGNKNINQKFLFYFTTTYLFQSQVKDLAYKKKAQPGLNSDHFKKIKIPLIPKTTQDQIVAKIEPIEKKIKELKAQIKPSQEIFNHVFATEFGFDLDKFEELKRIKNYYLDLSSFGNNKDMRNSVIFHQESVKFVMSQLKKVTSKKIKHFIAEPIVLGASISPSDFNENGEYYYISMATVKNYILELDESQLVSNDYSKKNLNKSIMKNDIIMTRSGVAIGKFALVEVENNGIFADFTMRIRLKNYNPYFAYYYFRSEYFQHLIYSNKKGLQNKNIFPSQIQEFPMINISLKEQQKIVDEIKTELDKQEEMNENIKAEIKKIDEIIEKAIK